MTDSIRAAWLEAQFVEAMSFSERSDVLNLAPLLAPGDGFSPYKYIAEFRCRGLAMMTDGVEVVDRHLVGITFPEQYLRTSSDPGQVLTWLEPDSEFHPNIKPPFCCVGHIAPGMSLMSLLHQLYQMITYQRYTSVEADALNRDACSWARDNLDRFPIDTRCSMLASACDREDADV